MASVVDCFLVFLSQSNENVIKSHKLLISTIPFSFGRLHCILTKEIL